MDARNRVGACPWSEHDGIPPTGGDTGAQERRLAAPRAAHYAEPSVSSELLDRVRNRLIATAESIVVITAIGPQPLIRTLGRRRCFEVFGGDRVDRLTRGEAFERVCSEVHDVASVRDACAERLVRRRRQKDVAAVRQATNSRRQIYGRAEVGLVALLGETRVEPDPHGKAELIVTVPPQRALERNRCGDSVGRVWEHRDCRIPLAHRQDEVPTVGGDRAGHEAVVPNQCARHGVGLPFPKLARALDVRKGKGEDPRRQRHRREYLTGLAVRHYSVKALDSTDDIHALERILISECAIADAEYPRGCLDAQIAVEIGGVVNETR